MNIQYVIAFDVFHLGTSLEAFEEAFPFLCVPSSKKEEKKEEKGTILPVSNEKEKEKSKRVKLYRMDRNGKYRPLDSTHLVLLYGSYPNVILRNELYLGNIGHSRDLNIMAHLGITHIVNVTVCGENMFENWDPLKAEKLVSKRENTLTVFFSPFSLSLSTVLYTYMLLKPFLKKMKRKRVNPNPTTEGRYLMNT